MNHAPTALLVATMDTKAQEALYIVDCLKAAGIRVMILDGGIMGNSMAPVQITREEVAGAGGKTLSEVQNIGHEGKSLEIMTNGAIECAQKLFRKNEIQGIIGLGGSMGTTLGTGVMRSFPVGFPKIMISTMASRDTRAFVGTKDILMLHSVCDLAGLNRVTTKILRNGAFALAGMVSHKPNTTAPPAKRSVFLSTLGTTETCTQRVRKSMEQAGEELIIFHTVGSGGKAMEEMLVQEKAGILVDLSLHEIADHLFGGDYDAGPDRGKVALNLQIPTILVPGNIDFLVTGPLEAAQRLFPNRPYHSHNAAITVVRTEQNEIAILAQKIADLCNAAEGKIDILVPMAGFSAFDHPAGPLHDPEAPEIFLKSLENNLDTSPNLKVLPYHINDPEFAQELVTTIEVLLSSSPSLQ